MAYEREQFRIIPDPNDAKRWAYERLSHQSHHEPVGGFQTAKAARAAFERTRGKTPDADQKKGKGR